MLKNIYRPDKFHCLPKKRNFLARAGLPGSKQPAEVELIKKANQISLLGIKVIQPLVYYLTAPAVHFPPELIPDSFTDIKTMTVFASTLGHSLDALISEFYEKSKTLEAFLLDSWGSESLEALNKHFDHWLRQEYGPGTRRFSPGYGRVDIRMNRFIIQELLKINEKEIKVLESGVMIPRKTTTCLIGWYDEKK